MSNFNNRSADVMEHFVLVLLGMMQNMKGDYVRRRCANYIWKTLAIACFQVLFVFGSYPANARESIIGPNEHGESGDAKGTYFRLYAEYLIGDDETLVFDLQVSCGTHTFADGRRVRGYLPALYAKKTSSGAAVMIATPRICDGIRNAEGRQVSVDRRFKVALENVLEGNFIPFTVWYEDADDLTLGYGYPVAESFANTAFPLKFINATVEPSSPAIFADWFEKDDDNILSELHAGPRYSLSERAKSYWAEFVPGKKLFPLSCTGVAIIELLDRPSAEVVKQFYPDNMPRYWLAPDHLSNKHNEDEITKADLVPSVGFSSIISRDFFFGFNYLRKDKFQDARHLARLWTIPHPDYYPAIRSDGYPFVRERGFESDRLQLSVDLRPDQKGLLACYSQFNPIGYGSANLETLYEYYFGADYGPRLATFGQKVDLVILDTAEKTTLENVDPPMALPHFLIGDQAVAEFVTFDFFTGGHVK